MRHIMLLCYLLTIIIGVSGLTIQILVKKDDKSPSNFLRKDIMSYFIVALLTMNVYDAIIYYSDYLITGFDNISLVKIGDCIIVIIVFLWLEVEKKLVGDETNRLVERLCLVFAPIYFLVWIIGAFIASSFVGDGLRWLCAIVDMCLVVILVGCSMHYIFMAAKKGISKLAILYMTVVTLMMIINYGSYYVSEMYVRIGEQSFHTTFIDLTVIYWFVINIANLILIYKYIYTPANHNTTEEFDLNEALDELQNKYDLTNREKELTRLIYIGKSNADISRELFISESTVKTHVYNIFRKLGVKNRIETVCRIRGE